MSGTVFVAVAVLASLQPSNRKEEKERSRFLTLAVLEGLYEDGVKPGLVQALAKDNFQLFVAKCPICMPVNQAFRMLAAAPPPLMYDGRGDGFPKAIEAQLTAEDLPTRKKGLEALIQRYVEQRFERLKLSDADKARLRQSIADGRKEGARIMNPTPGDFCPSCDGAAKAGKP